MMVMGALPPLPPPIMRDSISGSLERGMMASRPASPTLRICEPLVMPPACRFGHLEICRLCRLLHGNGNCAVYGVTVARPALGQRPSPNGPEAASLWMMALASVAAPPAPRLSAR